MKKKAKKEPTPKLVQHPSGVWQRYGNVEGKTYEPGQSEKDRRSAEDRRREKTKVTKKRRDRAIKQGNVLEACTLNIMASNPDMSRNDAKKQARDALKETLKQATRLGRSA